MVLSDTFKVISLFGADVDQWARGNEFEPMTALLSKDEIERADRFQFEHLKERFLWGRVFLRQVLGRLTGVEAADVQFGVGFNGKPFLEGSRGTAGNFSFSRSGRFVVCCFATESQVGMDVEVRKELEDMAAISRTIFRDDSYTKWDALPEEQKLNAFYQSWTRKEAVAKVDGQGISNGLADIDVPLGNLERSKATCVRLHESALGQEQVGSGLAVLSDWCPFDEVAASVAFELDLAEGFEVEFCDQSEFNASGGEPSLFDSNFPIVVARRQFSFVEKENEGDE